MVWTMGSNCHTVSPFIRDAELKPGYRTNRANLELRFDNDECRVVYTDKCIPSEGAMEEALTPSITRPLTSIYDPVIVWDLYELLTLTWQISCHTSTLALFMWVSICVTPGSYMSHSGWPPHSPPPTPSRNKSC